LLTGRVTDIEDGAFNGLEKNLKVLQVDYYGQNDLPTNAISKLTQLEKLELEWSHIKNIPVDAFTPFKNLKVLDFDNGNADLDDANNKGAFLSLPPDMEILSLERNKLRSLPKTNLRSLKVLSLSGNNITKVTKDELPYGKSLTVLRLEENPVDTIETDAIAVQVQSASLLDGIRVPAVDLAIFDWSSQPSGFYLSLAGNDHLKTFSISDISKIPEKTSGIIMPGYGGLEEIDKSIGNLIDQRSGIDILLYGNTNFKCQGSEWLAYYVFCTEQLNPQGTMCVDQGGKLLADYLKEQVPNPCGK
jgi:Leucine-rich repeat (LRR) protein